MIEIINSILEGVKIIIPHYCEDNRGYFLKSIERETFLNFGLEPDISESFETFSIKGVIRGLHFQTKNPQVKIVRAITGAIYDVVVDLRRDSQTFGEYAAFELNCHNHYALWIPAGFAHGYKVLSEAAIVTYACIGEYHKDYDTGIKWDDPDLAISWNITAPIVSPRDNSLQNLKTFIQKTGGL